jgi:Transposase, Mutator family
MRHDYSTEQFQAFRGEVRESFWGQVRWRTQHVLQQFLEADSEQQMAEYLGLARYERSAEGEDRVDSRNGFYERDYVTPLGSIRLRVRRTRKRSFLPRGLQTLQRRAPEVAELIRQAFLRGISTRAVGRVVALLTDEPVSAQTVSRLTRVLDQQVEKFHHAALEDDWAYLLLCWWPTGCVAMARASCWRSLAPGAKAKRPGKHFCGMCTSADWPAVSCRW